ncbi:VOC family protein [Aeromicrobium endophyticum]|uniref:VOC family protein n=1 Tax=Aeromicrobium endophyticum TaxID=2292704 RepID=A0A371P9W8_9ACTN|nr:VOC family protein [Aeromicrobium endophyticum]REK72731.1 VOC family protein [Aeromicrobium endophyticum]
MSHPTPSPAAPGRIAATIPVTDVDRSLEFYRRFLGLEATFVNGQPVGFAIVRNGPAELHLTLVKQHRPAAHNVAHVLVDDATGLYEAMDAAGVRIVKGLRDADYGLRGFVFCDPDGNRIDVGQALS